MTPLARKVFVLATASVLLLQACATQQPEPALPDFSRLEKTMKAGECNPVTAALIGAALGAMIADENRTKGAAIGAGLGALACYIINAGGSVRAGQEARVSSSIALISGSREPVRDVVEILEVFESGDPAKVMLRAEKKAEPGMLTGGIQNSFSIRLPEGLAAGSYPARTVLYVNGKAAGENRGALRVL